MIIVTHDPTAMSGQDVATGKKQHKETTITEFPDVMEQVFRQSKGEITTEGNSTLTSDMPKVQKMPATDNRTVAGSQKTQEGITLQTTQQNTPVAAADMAKSEYDEIIDRAAKKYGVDASLIKAMIKMESDFQPNCVSRSGAMGLMQLMPATADFLGVKDPFDPEQNIMGGTRYISDKLKAYDGNLELALSAYNAGSGTVARYGGVPPQCKTYISKILSYKEAYETAQAAVS